jgi:uncharacterized membrane protein
LLWTALGFLTGALIGHYLALQRDRRKEFSEVADPVRIQLRRELSNTRASPDWADADALSLLGDMVQPWKRRSFRRAVAEYQQSREQCTGVNSSGRVYYASTEAMEKAIHQLLAKLDRR